MQAEFISSIHIDDGNDYCDCDEDGCEFCEWGDPRETGARAASWDVRVFNCATKAWTYGSGTADDEAACELAAAAFQAKAEAA